MSNFFIKEQHGNIQQTMPALSDMNIPHIPSGNQNIEFVRSIAEKLHNHKQEMNDLETTLQLQDWDNEFRSTVLTDPNYANTEEGRAYVRDQYNSLLERKKRYLQERKKDIGDSRFLQQVSNLKNRTAQDVEKLQYQENHGFVMDNMVSFSNNLEIIKDTMWHVGVNEDDLHEQIRLGGLAYDRIGLVNGDNVDTASQMLHQFENSLTKGIVNLFNDPRQFIDKTTGAINYDDRELGIQNSMNVLLDKDRIHRDAQAYSQSLKGKISVPEAEGIIKTIRGKAFDEMLNKNNYYKSRQQENNQILIKANDKAVGERTSQLIQNGTVQNLSNGNKLKYFDDAKNKQGIVSVSSDESFDKNNMTINLEKYIYSKNSNFTNMDIDNKTKAQNLSLYTEGYAFDVLKKMGIKTTRRLTSELTNALKESEAFYESNNPNKAQEILNDEMKKLELYGAYENDIKGIDDKLRIKTEGSSIIKLILKEINNDIDDINLKLDFNSPEDRYLALSSLVFLARKNNGTVNGVSIDPKDFTIKNENLIHVIDYKNNTFNKQVLDSLRKDGIIDNMRNMIVYNKSNSTKVTPINSDIANNQAVIEIAGQSTEYKFSGNNVIPSGNKIYNNTGKNRNIINVTNGDTKNNKWTFDQNAPINIRANYR